MTAAARAQRAATAGVAAALGATLIWGAQLPIAKGAYAAVDGITLTLVRYGVALPAFAALLVWREGPAALAADRRGWLAAAAAGCALTGSLLCLFIGLSMTRPEVAAIILALQPAMTALAEWGRARRRPPAFTLACIVIAFVGVALVVTRGGAAFHEPAAARDTETLGNLLALCAAVLWVAYALLTPRMAGWSALRISTLTSIPVLVLVVLAWFVAHAFGGVRIEVAALAAATWRFAYLSLLGVVAGMLLWNAGLQRIGAVDAMLLANMMPIAAFVYRAFEGVRYQPVELAGAALVIGALVANSLSLRRGRKVPA